MWNLHVRVFSQTHDEQRHKIKDETSTCSRRHEQKLSRPFSLLLLWRQLFVPDGTLCFSTLFLENV